MRTSREKVLIPERTSLQVECRIKMSPLKDYTTLTFEPDLDLKCVTVHGFPVPSSPCLVCMRVRMCEQVSVGVCD